jgi:hypothetical protein
MVTRTMGGPTSPAKAAMPPMMPRKRDPNTTDRLTTFGPGRKWQSAKVSLNSSAVIQRCSSTMPHRANASTPPNPASDIFANAKNSARTLGRGGLAGAEIVGAGAAAGGESGGMGKKSRTSVWPGPPNLACSAPEPSNFGLRMCRFGYCLSQPLPPILRVPACPAMEINRRRNKPFGPGGGTRRLHQSPPRPCGLRRGRNRIDEGVKGVLFPGIVPPLSGYCNSCQRQLCSGCSGCVTQSERPT